MTDNPGNIFERALDVVTTGDKGAQHKGEWTVPATVVRVVDGDTLYVTLDLGWHIQLTDYVRLLGINAPEAKTKEGDAATLFVKDLVKPGDRVTVVSKKLLGQTEVHGRVLANVTLANGDNLSDKVLEAGHAVEYK